MVRADQLFQRGKVVLSSPEFVDLVLLPSDLRLLFFDRIDLAVVLRVVMGEHRRAMPLPLQLEKAPHLCHEMTRLARLGQNGVDAGTPRAHLQIGPPIRRHGDDGDASR